MQGFSATCICVLLALTSAVLSRAAGKGDDVSVRLLGDLVDPSTGDGGGDSIVGGVNAANNEFPFAAALYRDTDTPGAGETATCTGSLIHPSVVMTAAHCIGNGLISGSSWVYVGQTDINGIPDGQRSFKVRATRVLKNPGYLGDGNDIALVFLANPVGGMPVRIENTSSLTAENTNQNVLCIGYGQISYPNGPGARYLQKIVEPLYPICECYQQFNWQDFNSDAEASRQACYYPPSTVHRVCFGDSGGPMLTGSSLDEFKVRGIVSFGPGCNERVPDIYTRVSAYAGWIESQVAGGLSSRSSAVSVQHVGVGKSEWQSYPLLVQGNRACTSRGWLGGFNVNFAPAGSAFGAICFSSNIAEVRTATTDQLNALSADIRQAASLYCGAIAGFVAAGVWNGEQTGNNRQILCLKNKSAFLGDIAKTTLTALSADRDQAATLYAQSVGFKFALASGAETSTRRSLYFVGSSMYSWDYDYGTLTDAVIEQDCIPNCPKTCLHRNIGNGICNGECNIATCQFDKGDCSGGATPQPTVPTANCATGCTNPMVGDGTCQPQCNNDACNQDGGDCETCDREACPSLWLADGECDQACDNAGCGFDNGDCVRTCPASCNRANLGNGICNAKCNNKACNFDNGDCVKAECLSSGCPLTWLRDTECDSKCNSPACEFDKGDCTPSPTKRPTKPLPITRRCKSNRCRRSWIGDGECDPGCNTRPCAFDRGDCAK